MESFFMFSILRRAKNVAFLSFCYSKQKTVSVAFGKNLAVRVFPNPIRDALTIEWSTEVKTGTIELVDVLGRSVFRQNTEGVHLLEINTTNWQSGIYILKVSDNTMRFQQKIVKQ
jgi:Secretion system C-terminal sorting domain